MEAYGYIHHMSTRGNTVNERTYHQREDILSSFEGDRGSMASGLVLFKLSNLTKNNTNEWKRREG